MQPSPPPTASKAKPDPAAAPPRILIADDNPQGAELLEAYLAEGGYEIRTRKRSSWFASGTPT
jgi:PleD family two-component response regulator